MTLSSNPTPLPHSPAIDSRLNAENRETPLGVGERKNKRVFTDFHHSGLLNSLQLLFEDRFGWELYRPIGRAWHTEGYWHIYNHPATVAQYLDIGGATPDGSAMLNNVSDTVDEVIYLCQDISSEKTNKAIGLTAFLKMNFDVVIASIPQHVAPFRELCDRHPSKPILIYQIGNDWNISDQDAEKVDMIMASALIDIPDNIPHVLYHQEFSTDIFSPELPYYGSKQIASFVNVFTKENSLFRDDVQLFEKVEQLLPDYNFKIFGGQGRDGVLHGDRAVAREMSRSLFVWHTKNGGDGYGHIIHNTFAMNRPTIIKSSYYRGKLAGVLIKPDENCIDIDNLTAEQIADKIRRYSDPDVYNTLSRALSETVSFKHLFELEAQGIKRMIENLLDTR